jgi:hypothetical protein
VTKLSLKTGGVGKRRREARMLCQQGRFVVSKLDIISRSNMEVRGGGGVVGGMMRLTQVVLVVRMAFISTIFLKQFYIYTTY